METTQEERVMAAISHASILLPTTGIVVPILVWATQKDKSPFLRDQALQATVYHLTMVLMGMVGLVLYMVSFFGTFGLAFASPGAQPGPVIGIAFALPFVTILAIFLGYFGLMAYGLVGAVATLRGRPFRYAVLGAWLENSRA